MNKQKNLQKFEFITRVTTCNPIYWKKLIKFFNAVKSINSLINKEEENKQIVLMDIKKQNKIIHAGDEIKCEICGKCFTRKKSLNAHVKTVHEGIKNHNCKKCGKEFARLYHLKRHINSVYSCSGGT